MASQPRLEAVMAVTCHVSRYWAHRSRVTGCHGDMAWRVTRSAPGTRAWWSWSWWGSVTVPRCPVSVWLWTRGRAARDCRAGGAAPRCPARTPVCPPGFLPHKFPGVLATVGPWPGTVVTLLDLSAGLREISKCVKAKGQSWAILLVSLC